MGSALRIDLRWSEKERRLWTLETKRPESRVGEGLEEMATAMMMMMTIMMTVLIKNG